MALYSGGKGGCTGCGEVEFSFFPHLKVRLNSYLRKMIYLSEDKDLKEKIRSSYFELLIKSDIQLYP